MTKKKKNRNYDREFIEQTVNLAKTSDKSISAIARDLGIPLTTLHAWVGKFRNGVWSSSYDRDTGTVPEQRKINELEKKLKSVELERDILKKAMAYFAAPQR